MEHQIGDSAVKTAASETSLNTTEVESVLNEFQGGLEDEFYSEMKNNFVPGGSEEFLVKGLNGGYWFAIYATKFRSIIGREMSDDERLAIAIAHETEFQNQGLAMEIPQTYVNSHDVEWLIPVMVASSDEFHRGVDASYFHLLRLVSYDLTPAEALDYFVVEDGGWDKETWIARRGVGREAVNKNLRAAREKLDQSDLPNSEKKVHPAKDIRAISKDETEEEGHAKRVRPREEYDERV